MGSMKKIVFVVMLVVLSAVACQFAAQQQVAKQPTAAAEATVAEHPEDMGTKDCAECHVEVTPEIYQQWEQSAHGFVGVKCQVCHGDAVNFVKSPTNEKCEGCHSKQIENNVAQDIKCATCHVGHNFTVHKAHDYK